MIKRLHVNLGGLPFIKWNSPMAFYVCSTDNVVNVREYVKESSDNITESAQ